MSVKPFIEYKHVFVSSENRDQTKFPSGNTYVLHLTTPVKNIKRVELLCASVPNTMYTLSDGTNVISVSNVNATQGEDLTQISIPPGYYTGSGLASEITNAISNISNITTTFLSNEGKFLFTRPSTNPFSIQVNSAELRNMLGMVSGVIDSDNVATDSTSLTIPLYSDNSRYRDKDFIKSTSVANLHPEEGIFLDIEQLRTNLNEDALPQTSEQIGFYTGQNIRRTFGLIPLDVNGGEIKRFKKTTDYDFAIDYPYPIQSIDRVNVSWINKSGIPVNFQGYNDNSFLLRFHTVADSKKNP